MTRARLGEAGTPGHQAAGAGPKRLGRTLEKRKQLPQPALQGKEFPRLNGVPRIHDLTLLPPQGRSEKAEDLTHTPYTLPTRYAHPGNHLSHLHASLQDTHTTHQLHTNLPPDRLHPHAQHSLHPTPSAHNTAHTDTAPPPPTYRACGVFPSSRPHLKSSKGDPQPLSGFMGGSALSSPPPHIPTQLPGPAPS